uniref:Peptidase M24 domain-containing protein n=1 Tax=Piliocolobus tephrosceles TaxID=591936 RepID=A0A8C9GFM6_9PRIM
MKCKESYNKMFSHLHDYELFSNFQYVGRQKKGVLSPKYYLPKYIERPNYHKTGVPTYINYDSTNSGTYNNQPLTGKHTKTDTNITNANIKKNDHAYEYNNVKSDDEVEIIANNCKFARNLMDDVSYIICEGITTNDIDIYILNKCINNGYYPSPLNYHLFPKSSCISINEILCHGIPDNNILFENDIVKVDISIYKSGYHADMCESFLVEKVGKKEQKKRKKYYDYIYLNNKLKTKYTKYIFKYHFDLTKNMIVKKGKQCSIIKKKFVAPNSKAIQNDNYDEDFDDNTNSVHVCSNMYSNYYNKNSNYREMLKMNESNGLLRKNRHHITKINDELYDDLESFHKQYDEAIIYNPSKGNAYNDMQKYIYNSINRKNEKSDKNKKKYHFFDESKSNVNDLKKYMLKKNMKLIKTAYECTMAAISICKHGVPFKTIADVMNSYLQKKNNAYEQYSIVPNLCGHNIGKNFHEEPFIIHTINNDERKMTENMVFTIEPIITERSCNFIMWPDNWTLSNSRYYFSAQFEHTIVIKKNEAQILTKKL